MKITARHAVLAVTAGLLAACGGEPEQAGEASAPAQPAELPRNEAPPGAAVFFITPGDGDTVSSPFPVKFGISGMTVAPAGDTTPRSGHHHLLIDTQLENSDLPVPKDDQHRHFGGGQTETELELAPGTHTLQLVLGDANHIPHEPPVMSDVITVTVE